MLARRQSLLTETKHALVMYLADHLGGPRKPSGADVYSQSVAEYRGAKPQQQEEGDKGNSEEVTGGEEATKPSPRTVHKLQLATTVKFWEEYQRRLTRALQELKGAVRDRLPQYGSVKAL